MVRNKVLVHYIVCQPRVLPSSSTIVITVWSGVPNITLGWPAITLSSPLKVSSRSRQLSSRIGTVISTEDSPAGIVIGVMTGGLGFPSVP